MSRRRDERGEAAVLIVGFAILLLMLTAAVVDASAAFLRHQSLDDLADGAALAGADAGAQGPRLYTGGLDDGTVDQSTAAAQHGVDDYLGRVGAYGRYPGLRAQVTVTGGTVTVHLTEPLDLPLSVPGSPSHPTIGAVGSAHEPLDPAA